jgi:GTP-binding protein
VAFLGRSNVGKSSLLNALVGVRGLARVSAQPGRTRLVNFFRVNDEFYFADLPGYGYARVPEAMRRSWEGLVTSYLEDRAPLALSVFVVDARHDPMKGDEMLRRYLDHRGVPYVVAATKSDHLSRDRARRRVAELRAAFRGAADVVATSAETGEGLEALWKAIRAAVEGRARRREARHAGD